MKIIKIISLLPIFYNLLMQKFSVENVKDVGCKMLKIIWKISSYFTWYMIYLTVTVSSKHIILSCHDLYHILG